LAVLLLSTYDLGRQPFGLASPAAWLRNAGCETATRDLSRDRLDEEEVRAASVVAFFLPMHTATRLAVPVIKRVRALNPSATLCAYGLYAPLSDALLREIGVSVVLGPEAERDLVDLATGRSHQPAVTGAGLPRLAFAVPDRTTLAPLDRYASLQLPDGGRRIAGSTDATRGCKHRCRHCPIVPVYDGQFRVVPAEVVLADIEQQIACGAEHITFGDPDFFNGPAHARRIVEALHGRHPHVSYDVTIKVEHLLRERRLLPVLAQTGCAFVTSAVEAVDDDILAKLEKGHTREDFITAAGVCRDAGLTLAPTFVAFTPWTTVEGYRDLLETVASLGLVEHVAPVQWGLRLLVTYRSRLLELDDIHRAVGPFDRKTLTYPWVHDDPRVDRLQSEIMEMIGTKPAASRGDLFGAVAEMAGLVPDVPAGLKSGAAWLSRSAIPYLNEPWYC
jgi:radical SAM superfamily enzyme YgiQ (UPF0313 family)